MANQEELAAAFARTEAAVEELKQALWALSAFDAHEIQNYVVDVIGYDNTIKWRDEIIEKWFDKLGE